MNIHHESTLVCAKVYLYYIVHETIQALIMVLMVICMHINSSVFSIHCRLLIYANMSSVQSQIQQDWNNREFVEVIASSIKKIAEFLNAFDLSARSRLAVLNQKLTYLERQVEYIEARVLKNWQHLLIHSESYISQVSAPQYELAPAYCIGSNGYVMQLAIVPGLLVCFIVHCRMYYLMKE